MPLSVQKRWEIIFLSLHAKGPQLNPAAVSKIVNCSRNTVYHWIQIYKDSGDVMDTLRSGRPHISSEKVDELIINSVEDDSEITSTRISEKLKRRGVHLSARTVRRRLNQAGFSSGIPIFKPLLSCCHRVTYIYVQEYIYITHFRTLHLFILSNIYSFV